MNTEKIYIGKGNQVKNYDMYNVTINLSKAEAQVFEINGEKFLKLTISRTKQPDDRGRTHTAYVTPFDPSKKANAAVAEPEVKITKKSKNKTKAIEKLEPSFSNH